MFAAMVSKKETATVRKFVSALLREEPDLSALTLGILKKRYLAHVGYDTLSRELKEAMKQVVAEELMKMEDNDSGSEVGTKTPQSKRKREEAEEDEKVLKEEEDEYKAKKIRINHSSSESEVKEDCKEGSEESEDEGQNNSGSDEEKEEVKKSQPNENGNRNRRSSGDQSSDEEFNDSEEKGSGSPKEINSTSDAKNSAQSDEESESDIDDKSEKSNKNSGSESSDEGDGEEKVPVEKKNNDTDSDSSSLASLDDEQQNELKNPKVQKETKQESTKRQKDGEKSVNRLKHYILLCGVRKNYKKLLEGCHTIKSKVALLKKELEDLGIDGTPTIKKCKKVKIKREEAQELAALDVSNIITTQGRPKRRGAWQEPSKPSSSPYQRALDSGSGSDQENKTHKGCRRVTDWANLQGIISDDGDSD